MMSDFARDRLDLDDEDRLPWLEPAAGFDEDGGAVSPLKLVAFALAGLLVLAAIVGAVYALRNMSRGSEGEGKLISAPQGSYKIPASEADAKKFAGEGDASFAASEGMARDGRIDTSRVPETPVAGGSSSAGATKGDAMTKALTRPEAQVTAPVTTVAATGKAAPKASAAVGGAMIQLGAYGSTAVAKDAWSKLSKRFDYLAPLGTSIESVSVGGTTLYRLRASAGSSANASALCGRLKVAGESCMVVN